VAGAVRRPGLYKVASDARVADAVRAAGGPTPRADLDALNLAEPLVDGTKIDVLQRGEVAPPGAGVTPAPEGAAPAALIPLNSADQAALESIPEVGPVTALAILEYRTEIGGFSSIDQLLEVSGIGPATLEAIRPYVTL
jgi:competence protein ComEA